MLISKFEAAAIIVGLSGFAIAEIRYHFRSGYYSRILQSFEPPKRDWGADRSRGELPPAESLQYGYTTEPRDPIGWPATFALCGLLALFVGWLVLR